ncbi:MAG: sulfotransferase domain-containing protein [Planctomycetes bacterium]|nr:sulfotransferase domain-containing protein [Planctomycetota bacterium]
MWSVRQRNNIPQLTGEASPYYFQHPLVPERVHQVVPKAKFLVILREPVQRAWSHYRHNLRYGREDLSFEFALDKEEDRARRDVPQLYVDTVFFPDQFLQYSYRRGSMYSDHLNNWLRFFPIDQFLFLEAEEFFASPRVTLDRVSQFLNIGPFPEVTLEPQNVGTTVIPADPLVLQHLRDFFSPLNEEFFQLIGKRFQSWESCNPVEIGTSQCR